jgi:hypothetical protein
MLDKATLISDLTTILQNKNPNKTPSQVANELANAIDKFVKSGTVISNGQTANTVPGAPAGIVNLNGEIR